MIVFNPSDVVLVSFPFTNLQTAKRRPAVIISSTGFNQNRPDVILMAISSQVRDQLSTAEALIQDWKQAGLAKLSVFKPLIATVEKQQIVRVLGSLSAKDQKQLQEIIQYSIETK